MQDHSHIHFYLKVTTRKSFIPLRNWQNIFLCGSKIYVTDHVFLLTLAIKKRLGFEIQLE